MQHTPGPWTFTRSNDVPIDDRIIGANNCSVMRGCIPNTPDALLIAAAPDMLAALVALRDAIADAHDSGQACAVNPYSAQYRAALDAIAQATGDA